MAQKVLVILTDDLSGEEADETVEFGLDGSKYEVDLTTANAKELRGILQKYIDAGRRTQARRGRKPAAVAAATTAAPKQTRSKRKVSSVEDIEKSKTAKAK